MSPRCLARCFSFGTGSALRVTRLGLVIVGICCRSPPGLKPHARRGERRGHRVCGLWCFERLIRVGHRDRLAERRIPKLCARPPRHVVTQKTVAGHSPAPLRLMLCGAGIDLWTMQREACGTALGRPAWVRFSVRPRDLIVGSCARRFGMSGRPVLRWQGHAGPAISPPSSPTTIATGTVRGFTGLRACRPHPRSSPPMRSSPPTL